MTDIEIASIIAEMDTLFVSLYLVITTMVPPYGVVQLEEPSFTDERTCKTWIVENSGDIVINVRTYFGPWARIIGAECLTEEQANLLNEKFGHQDPGKEFQYDFKGKNL